MPHASALPDHTHTAKKIQLIYKSGPKYAFFFPMDTLHVPTCATAKSFACPKHDEQKPQGKH